MAKPKTVRKKKAVVAPEVFRVGIILEACCCGFHMLPKTIQRLGYKPGCYLQLENLNMGNVVSRELADCRAVRGAMRSEYVYMDTETAHYLGVEPHHEVTIRPAPYEMDMP